MRPTPSVLFEVLRARLWVIPSLSALAAAAAALLLVRVDGAFESPILPLAIGPDSARALLSTISGAMISFTALVFSITMLVLQSASTQLSPRVTRTFLRDRFNQAVLGLFVATFVYSLLVLASVGDDVPELSVITAVALVLVAVLAFVSYIDHMAHDIRPTSVIESIAAEAHSVIERVYPDGKDASTEDALAGAQDGADEALVVTWSGPAGYVQSFDRDRLMAFARVQDSDVAALVGSGSFLRHGQPAIVVRGGSGVTIPAGEVGLEAALRVGPERTMSEDPAFGFRLLVDVALRALSPSLNDHSTAVQAIDRLHELLSTLQARPIPSPVVLASGARPRVRLPAPDWDAYVWLATSELGHACRTVPAVREHLLEMVASLLGEAPPERQPALRRAQAEIEEHQTA